MTENQSRVLWHITRGPSGSEGGTFDFMVATVLFWKLWAMLAVLFVGSALAPRYFVGDPEALSKGYMIGFMVAAYFGKWVGYE